MNPYFAGKVWLIQDFSLNFRFYTYNANGVSTNRFTSWDLQNVPSRPRLFTTDWKRRNLYINKEIILLT
jgi:hypothetical protein